MPLNVSKAPLDLLVFQPAMLRGADDRERIADIQLADQIEVKLEAGNFKLRGRRAESQVESLYGVVRSETEFFHRAMRDV